MSKKLVTQHFSFFDIDFIFNLILRYLDIEPRKYLISSILKQFLSGCHYTRRFERNSSFSCFQENEGITTDIYVDMTQNSDIFVLSILRKKRRILFLSISYGQEDDSSSTTTKTAGSNYHRHNDDD
jgi:hypothetical protein